MGNTDHPHVPRHIGIVACSAEGAALCYRTICSEAAARMGEHDHPEVSMHTHPLARYMVHIRADDWAGVAELMLSSVTSLARIGAELAVCPDNTIHQAFDLVAPRSPIPWLHIAREVALVARDRAYAFLGITGTKYLTTGPVYPGALGSFGIRCEIPDDGDRELIDRIIFTELVNGIFRRESRRELNRVIAGLMGRGCDAVVLGCTELPLLADPGGAPLPLLDSTRILARAALREAFASACPQAGGDRTDEP